MNPNLLILGIVPILSACGLEELFNPGQSQQRSEYRASIMAPTSPTMPVESPTEVADGVSPILATPEPEPEITIAQEPVYVQPEPAPECLYDLYMIYKCVGGVVVHL